MATLEELDARGTLEQLDSYGTLEQLDAVDPPIYISSSISIALTTTAALIYDAFTCPLETLDSFGDLESLDSFGSLEDLNFLEPINISGTGLFSMVSSSATPTLLKLSATLEQLDAYGTLEELDAFGNGTLEHLNFLVVHEASAADSIAMTETANAIRVPTVSASDTLSLTTTSTSNFLVNIDGTGAISISAASTIDRFRTVNDQADIAITAVIPRFTKFMSPSFVTANLVMSGECLFQRRRFLSGSTSISINTNMLAEILGETWTDVTGRSVTWSVLQ